MGDEGRSTVQIFDLENGARARDAQERKRSEARLAAAYCHRKRGKKMEIVIIIGMIAAFLAGAYVRKPFAFVRKERETIEAEPEKETGKPPISEQLVNLLSYDGRPQGDE